MAAMAKCYFVSDLHLFANRSKANKYLDDMLIAASQARLFRPRRRYLRFLLGADPQP